MQKRNRGICAKKEMRGQITIFIIIGILILVTLAVYLTLTPETTEQKLQVYTAPTEVQPLQDFAQQCIEQTTKTAIKILGEQGGYINADRLMASMPTEGNAVEQMPGTKTAYWWHMKSPNNCQTNCEFTSERPQLRGTNSIQQQITNYLTEEIPKCIDNFKVFQQQGFDTTTQTAQVETTITQQEIIITLTYPATITKNGVTYNLEKYSAAIPVQLEKMYDVLTEITNYQIENNFLEQATLTIINSFSDTDNDKLPPTREFYFGPPKQNNIWIKNNVENKLTMLLATYIPVIQTLGTKNYNYIMAPTNTQDEQIYEILYNRDFYLPINISAQDIEIRFYYLNWKPYFDLNCNGQICQPDATTDNGLLNILPITMQRYQFAYDLSYPVMIEARDKNGYRMTAMLEQNIRKSQAFKGELKKLNTQEFEPSQLCNPEYRTTGNITVNVNTDASITYNCGDVACVIGNTINGKLVTQYPRCIGATLEVSAQQHETKTIPIETTDEEQTINVDLYAQKTLQTTVRNYVLTKNTGWQWISASGILNPPAQQNTIIQLTREDGYVTYTTIKGTTPSTITLLPGTYDVAIDSFYEGEYTIQPKTECVESRSKKNIFKKTKECYQIPEEPMHFGPERPLTTGHTEYKITITPQQLTGTKIDFRHVALGLHNLEENERDINDLGETERTQLYAESLRMQPVIT